MTRCLDLWSSQTGRAGVHGSLSWEFSGRFGVYEARCEKLLEPYEIEWWVVEIRVGELSARIDNPVTCRADAAVLVETLERRLGELADLELEWRNELSFDFVPVMSCSSGTTRVSVFVADDDEWPSAYVIVGLGGRRATYEELWLEVDCADLREVHHATKRTEHFIGQIRQK